MKKRLTIIGAAAMVAASATLPLAAAAETASATADTPIAVDTREGEQPLSRPLPNHPHCIEQHRGIKERT